MPHARIDMHRTLQPKMAEMSAAILRGMVTGFDMPADDFFQAFRLHDEGELFYSPTFPHQQRDDIIFIELIASKGYSDAQKQHAMEAIVEEVSAVGIKRDNLLLVINEVGQGATWYAPEPVYRTLSAGQRSQVWIGGRDLAEPQLLFETDKMLIEAPNWTTDGAALVLNGNGQLWRLEVEGAPADLVPIAFRDLPDVNNDHVLDPDGQHVYLSAMDRHIYRGALTGGPVTRLSPEDGHWHFLHGVSPDGSRLAYVEIDVFGEPGRLAVLEVGSDSPEIWPAGDGHLDGPEWSADGQWVYLNSEAFTEAPGHAQLARIPDGGGAIERLVASDTVDWFPHLSPDARYAAYISFPTGTVGHPADLDVEVRVVDVTDWSTPLQRYRVFGGQGTINVNSWAPDSSRFAFVGYPVG